MGLFLGGKVAERDEEVVGGREGLGVLRGPGMDYTTIVNMGVDDDEYSRVGGTDDPELSRIAFELGVSDGEDGGSVIIVKDLI